MDPSGSAGEDTIDSSSRPSSSLTSEVEKSLNAQSRKDDSEYPFACQTVISTGHKQNVFNAQMLPFSTKM